LHNRFYTDAFTLHILSRCPRMAQILSPYVRETYSIINNRVMFYTSIYNTKQVKKPPCMHYAKDRNNNYPYLRAILSTLSSTPECPLMVKRRRDARWDVLMSFDSYFSKPQFPIRGPAAKPSPQPAAICCIAVWLAPADTAHPPRPIGTRWLSLQPTWPCGIQGILNAMGK